MEIAHNETECNSIVEFELCANEKKTKMHLEIVYFREYLKGEPKTLTLAQ